MLRRPRRRFTPNDARSLFAVAPEKTHWRNSEERRRPHCSPPLDSRTLTRLLIECSTSSLDLEAAKVLHSLSIKLGFSSDPYSSSALADLYSKCGLVKDARKVFDDMPTKDQVLWNVAISSCALNGLEGEAFKLYGSMKASGFSGDEFTFSSLITSCASMGCKISGRQIHALAIKLSLDSDTCLASTLIHMYSKCGDISNARKMFDFLPERSLNTVSWNSIIVACGADCGFDRRSSQTMGLLLRMLRCGQSPPDEVTFSSVLRSCGRSAEAIMAAQLHGWVLRRGFDGFSSVKNALVATYSKCGSLCDSSQIFNSNKDPDLVGWSSMISSFGLHGRAEEAINLLERMLHEGFIPDEVTFLGVLSACSHAGLVENGLRYFKMMEEDQKVNLGSEHYSCLLDLLARAGRIEDAHELLVKMPMKPSTAVLAAFMGSSRVHGRTKLAKWAAQKLLEIEPNMQANWKVMSGVFAISGCWGEVMRVRKEMRVRCSSSTMPGCSWIELGNEKAMFVSGGRWDDPSGFPNQLYIVLQNLSKSIKYGCPSGMFFSPF